MQLLTLVRIDRAVMRITACDSLVNLSLAPSQVRPARNWPSYATHLP
jgi:hypothetical protein